MNEGKKDRRDPIRTIKARNPVAKNATSAIGGGAAGAHKDKKKAAKQGEVKHKGQEYAEHLEQALKNKLNESQTFIVHFADMDTDETDTASVVAPDINTARKIFSRENPELYIERIRPAGTQFARHDFGDEVDEDWIDDNAAEPLARYFADLYYGDFSSTEKVKLTSHIYNAIQNGELSIDQLKADIDMLEKEKGIGETRDAELNRKFNSPEQLKKDADYRAYRAGVKASRKQPPAPIKEFAPGGTMKPPAPPTAKKKDPFEDDDRSQLLMSIKNLLDKGAKIDSYLFGARGHITGVANDYFGFYFKKLNKPHSKSSFVRPMDGEDDESYMLKLVKPGYYQLWDKSIADAGEQGVAEGTGPQSKLDQKIIHLLTNGIPADAIARKLDIPIAWIDEVAKYNMPDSAIDYNDPRNTPPTNRFGEGVAEGIVDTIRSKNYARLADRSAAKRATALDNFDEPEHQKQTDIMKQRNLKSRLLNKKGVDEDVSRLSDSEYNRVAAYVRKKYPGTQLSGLGRNKDGSFNVMIDTGSGRHEFKVRFREPEETKLDELSPQTLKSYLKKSKGHSQKYDQKGNKADEKGDEELANKMWNKGDNRYAGAEQARAKLADLKDKKKGVAEEFDSPEYNDEAGMAETNLLTLARAVKGLYDTIGDDDNLPEWCQEKIAKAEMMLVSVWDYLLSQKEQGIDPKVSEASALEKFRKGSAERDKKHADIEAKRKANPGDSAGAVDRLAKHMDSKTESLRTENPCWKGYKPVGTKKKGGKTVPNCVPKEGWTHDSLADQLFEHERTYEEKLQNQLNQLTKR